jgi:hypothetical protein
VQLALKELELEMLMSWYSYRDRNSPKTMTRRKRSSTRQSFGILSEIMKSKSCALVNKKIKGKEPAKIN